MDFIDTLNNDIFLRVRRMFTHSTVSMDRNEKKTSFLISLLSLTKILSAESNRLYVMLTFFRTHSY